MSAERIKTTISVLKLTHDGACIGISAKYGVAAMVAPMILKPQWGYHLTKMEAHSQYLKVCILKIG